MKLHAAGRGASGRHGAGIERVGGDGKPLAKDCGPNNDYVIGFSQANFKEPYREHVNHELERLVKNYPKFKLVIADGQASVNTQVSPGRELHDPAGRPADDLALRGGAADAGRVARSTRPACR